jgi:type 1 glutamine amidotransferase
MKKFLIMLLMLQGVLNNIPATCIPSKHYRILVVTGGHDYKTEPFTRMLESLGENFSFQIAELPSAFNMFLPENRNKYDAVIFYHMWQTISPEQAAALSGCFREGKPLVALHHSICAFDDWPEYFNIIGGKYFHKPTVVNGKEYAVCSYIHDLHFTAMISDGNHAVTKGLKDFELFDETYKGYYIEEGVVPLITTDEPSSNHLIGWTKTYGKARVVTLQSGHDTPTFENPAFRKLLGQALTWVISGK